MKYTTLLVLALSIIMGCSGAQDTARQSQQSQEVITDTDSLLAYQKAITADYLKNHLTPLAADSMKGRETGMPGQKKAAKYLAEEYRRLGLKPVGDNQTYFQRFDLTADRIDSVVSRTWIEAEDSTEQLVSQSVLSKTSTGNYIRQFGGNSKIKADIVFGGYGIQNPVLNIHHLRGTDLKGKGVMIFEEVPRVVNGDTLYKDRRQFSRSRLRSILQQGAVGILLIPDMNVEEFEEASEEQQQNFGEPSGMRLAYRSKGSPGPAWSYTLINPELAEKILGSVDSADGLEPIKTQLANNIQSFEAKKTGYKLAQIPYATEMTIETENVVALMEGADPRLKDEVVVLSAHYDHVGIGRPDSTGDAIYNGANDDGSGTIGILAAARAFAKAREKGVQPERSILFLSVSGEEKGLLGSRYYSDHPLYPMEKTVANINTDMIGRVDPEHRKEGIADYVYIIGGKMISSQLDSLLRAGNRKAGNLKLDMRYNDLNDPNQFYRRSDHWNFGRFGVPFVFFFNGVHEDYHRPSDEVDKMNFDLFTQTVRSMYATTVMVANADSVPKVDNQEFIEITREDR